MRKFSLVAITAGSVMFAAAARANDTDWRHYGGNAGGEKFSSATQITPANVQSLKLAWTFRTGDMERRAAALQNSAFEATPIRVNDLLVLCTPFNEVIALDPGTGTEKWRFDPKIALDTRPGNQFVCRGVAQWTDGPAAGDAGCKTRIFMGTNDHRLFAIDAETGARCDGFRDHGEVAIDPGTELYWPGEFQITSPPAVVGDTVIVGSAILDNLRVEAPRGIVRAYDARTGVLRWAFDPLERSADGEPNAGHANVWAPMSVDEAAGLVFLPTSSPSPDFYGGRRPGANKYANSVVALEATTGKVVWSFQTVHHDLWDYDLASQPTLSMLGTGSGKRAAVFQGTKMGFIFALDRATGVPLFPVEERSVPRSDVAGETASPTQPFPVRPPPLVPHLDPARPFGFTPFDKNACREWLGKLRYEGPFTPPSVPGTAQYPWTGGGINWGGVAVDPDRQILVTNTSRLVHAITLIPEAEFEAMLRAQPDLEWQGSYFRQRGAPYGVRRELVLSRFGAPCNAPPWGMIHAIDLKSGAIKWERAFGTAQDLAPLGDIWVPKGSPNIGGPLLTASGLIFIGATHDRNLRAFDVETGKELWRARLPAGGQATPMTYEWKGGQYVVIAAGGHSAAGTKLGDYILAYALP